MSQKRLKVPLPSIRQSYIPEWTVFAVEITWYMDDNDKCVNVFME